MGGGDTLTSQNNVVNLNNEALLMNKLSQPDTIAQLVSLLDKLEQFNALFDTVGQFVARGPEMADSVNRLVVAMREDVPNSNFFSDLQKSLDTLKRLQTFMNSEEFKLIEESLLNEKTLKLLSNVTKAMKEASVETENARTGTVGVIQLMKEISSPEVQPAIQFVLNFAKILSKEINNA